MHRPAIVNALVTVFVIGSIAFFLSNRDICPHNMKMIDGEFCIDKFEAPNIKGELPLVMFSLRDSEVWCDRRGKRVCFDDEWERACVGNFHKEWMYGNKYERGICNDSKVWRRYIPRLLWEWEHDDKVLSFRDQAEISEHVRFLYQADPSGYNYRCQQDGVYDLLGNVEEWTKKRNFHKKSFSGKLKGRFWSEPRSCIKSVSNHGDLFRFYETGFRCCKSI